MADFTNSKPIIGDQYPQGAIETTSKSVEPLITAVQLRSRHLFGVDLSSGQIDRTTNKRAVMTDPILTDYIDRAVATVELETGLSIFPTEFDSRLPFDREEFLSWGYMRLPHRPIASVEYMALAPGDDTDLFVIPPSWISLAQAGVGGQVNLTPLTALLIGGAGYLSLPENNVTINGVAFIQTLSLSNWFASFFKVKYVAGFTDGMVPKVVNDLIGTIAAIDALSMLATTFAKTTSSSLSIDGASQATSGGGPELFLPRIKDLEKKRAMLVKKLKVAWGMTLFSSNV